MPDNPGSEARKAQLAAAKQALLNQRRENAARKQDNTHLQIQPRAASTIVPLSSGQMRLWYLSQFEDGQAIHNIVNAVRLLGKLDLPALRYAINTVVARHEALRMRFQPNPQTKNEVSIAIETSLDLEILLLEPAADEQRKDFLDDTLRQLSLLPFDLETAPLLRAHLLVLTPTEHVLVITVHHAVFDGVSWNLLIDEVFRHYAAHSRAAVQEPQPVALQYGDYCCWQQTFLQEDSQQRHLDYWAEQLAGDLPVLDLPADKPRKPMQSFAGDSRSILLEPALLEQLEAFSRSNNATLFMSMLAAFYCLLHRYSGQQDVIVGSPVAGRSQPQLQQAIGFFANTLPLRVQIDEQQSFEQLLQQVSDTCLAAYEHQDTPFELIVQRLKPPRDLSRTPIYQALFGFQLYEELDTGIPDLQARRVPLEVYLARTDLAFWHERDDNGMYVCAEFCSELFEAATIERMLQHYRTLLQSILRDSTVPTAQLPMLLDQDRRQLRTLNETSTSAPAVANALEMMRPHFTQRGEKIALIAPDRTLSYSELDRQSSCLANHLSAAGVGPGDCVGLCLERGANLLVSLLAIWKAGAAYVPLDPGFPQQRLLYMLRRADIATLVTQSSLQDLLLEHDCHRVLLDVEADTIAACSEVAPVLDATQCSLAYVIFTSGSTGQPKGVKVSHGAVVNFLGSMAVQPGLSEHDTLLAVTTLSFDIAVLELYLPLCVGASVCLADREQAADGQSLLQLLQQHQVTVMQATPASWRLLLAAGWQGNDNFKALCGGESLPMELARALLSRAAQVWNMYGPTETTVWSTCYQLQAQDQLVLIGRPIANTQCHVLDRQLQPVPPGAAGELFIGGDGLSDGYLGEPALTAQRFLPDPFSTLPGARMYRTGDRVRWRQNGQLEYLQRMDQQIKLRGFRIEPGEIEQALASHPAVSDCVVGVYQLEAGDERLAAWLCGDFDTAADYGELRDWLGQRLPDYMLPQLWCTLAHMPLTANGKIDRNALPAPAPAMTIPAQQSRATTETEMELAAIWCEVLAVEAAGIDDDFFDLGGHSLLGTRLFASINRQLGILLGLHELFRAPTIRQLAKRIEQEKQRSQQTLLIPHRPDVRFPCASSQQQRLWYLAQIHPKHNTHNLTVAWRLQGALDVDALQQALNALLQRQAALRSRVVAREGALVQDIEADFCLRLQPRPAGPLAASGQPAQLEAQRAAPFDLVEEPLLRTGLLQFGDDDYLLFLVVHHLVFDGQSFGILQRELFHLYRYFRGNETEELPSLPISYADFALWQHQWMNGPGVQKQLDYWVEHLNGELPILDLPLDKTRPADQAWQSAAVPVTLDNKLVQRLQQIAAAEGCSLFMLVLALYALTLYRFSRQTNMVVGVPVSGRKTHELQSLVGFFVNTLALRLEVDPRHAFRDCLAGVKQACLGAFSHPDVPFDLLVQQLNPARDPSRSPVYQTLFTYFDSRESACEVEDLHIEAVELALPGVQTDLDFWLERVDRGLVGGLEFPIELFEQETIQAIADSFITLAQRVSENVGATIHTLLRPTEEERELLQVWNATKREYPRHETLASLMPGLAQERGSKIALCSGSLSVNYAELEASSNQLAHHLIECGVQPGSLVGVCLNRGTQLVTSLLAIWKTGAAYVPLDAGYPEQRLQYMLESAAVPVLVTEASLADTVSQYSCQRVCIDQARQAIGSRPTQAPAVAIDPEAIAYVIFTSGSTGKPKGVQVPHRAVMNFLTSMAREPGLDARDVLLAVTTLSFDIAVLELYLPLLTGATLVIAESEQAADGEQLKSLLQQHNVTTMQATPGTWRMLLAAGWQAPAGFKILCGGEAFPAKLAQQLLADCDQVWNMYGPTETTVWSTCQRVRSPDDTACIGTPIANTQCHVLDSSGEQLPIGVAGELFIGGDGLAMGYLGRPDLSNQRFVADPRAEHDTATLYRTGDQVRWRRDGRLEYFRRIDAQVKLRGFRIEPGEVETALTCHPSISQASVLVKSYGDTDQRLVAYICFTGTESLTNTEMRRHLREMLPDYMIPQLFVELEQMPLTPNGKIDHKALPEPLQSLQTSQQATPPRSATERHLAEIWREALGIDVVDTSQNFFDIGGHSLLALDVIYRLETRYGFKVTPLDILLNSLAQIAAQIDQSAPAAPATTDANLRQSPAQRNIISRLFTRRKDK